MLLAGHRPGGTCRTYLVSGLDVRAYHLKPTPPTQETCGEEAVITYLKEQAPTCLNQAWLVSTPSSMLLAFFMEHNLSVSPLGVTTSVKLLSNFVICVNPCFKGPPVSVQVDAKCYSYRLSSRTRNLGCCSF